MKLDLSQAVVTYYSEGRAKCLGVTMKSSTGYILYRPTDDTLTDWVKIASAKTPVNFSDKIFNNSFTDNNLKTPALKVTKNNNEPDLKVTKNKIVERTPKKANTGEPRKVKKSFL